MMKKRNPGAVIIGGDFPSLGAARYLARQGVPVYIVDDDVCVSQFSRYVRHTYTCGSTKQDEVLVNFLMDRAADPDVDRSVLFPSTDEGVRILSQHRDELGKHYLVTVPPWEVTGQFYDKRRTLALAERTGVPTPKTYVDCSPEELRSMGVDFPLVVKPAVTSHFVPKAKKKAYRVDNHEELAQAHESMARVIDPGEILVQELIPGRAANLYSYFGFFRDGKPVSGGSANRIRQHPMDFGKASTFAITVNVPELETLATQLLSGIGYTGLAEVEFMCNPNHDRYELLEVNPRIWGWNVLAPYTGANLPYLAYADALGREVKPTPVRTGVKWMRFTTDIAVAATEIWHRRLSPGEYVKSLFGARDAVMWLSDPLPFLADVLLVPYHAKVRGF